MSNPINKPAHYNQGSIECIDAMQQILTPEEFRGFLKGNVFKYLWREKGKNGIEDLRKGKDYYDRLIQSFDESEDQPVIKQSSTTEPPDGWRWLEVGKVFRKGDTTNTIEPIPEHWVGTQCVVKHVALRRNRFEVGEKVVDCRSGVVFTVQHFNKTHRMVFVDGVSDEIESRHFAPYIEETT